MKLENLKTFLIILAIAGLIIILKNNFSKQNKIAAEKSLFIKKTISAIKSKATTDETTISNAIKVPQVQLFDISSKKNNTENKIRFNMKTGRCENDKQEEGVSETPYSECSDLSNRNLAHVPFGTFVIYGNNLKNSDMSKNNIDIYALLFGEIQFDRATIFPEIYGDIKSVLLETNLHIIDDISVANTAINEQKNILQKKFRELKSQYLNESTHPDTLHELTIQMQKIKTEMGLCDDKIRINSYKESRHKKFNRKIQEEL